jgi:hypothetical protein
MQTIANRLHLLSDILDFVTCGVYQHHVFKMFEPVGEHCSRHPQSNVGWNEEGDLTRKRYSRVL